MKKPLLLVACEYSQRVMSAFLQKGFDAYSCDIIDAEGDYPERHLKMDARKAVYLANWDLIIAHPPCTFLSTVQCFKERTNPYKNKERYVQMLEARNFFMFFIENTNCPLCVENPMPVKLASLPKETQIVTPSMFGSIYDKRTFLWLRDLPPLLPTVAKPLKRKSWHVVRRSSHDRSLLDPYFAQAMADQWAPLFL